MGALLTFKQYKILDHYLLFPTPISIPYGEPLSFSPYPHPSSVFFFQANSNNMYHVNTHTLQLSYTKDNIKASFKTICSRFLSHINRGLPDYTESTLLPFGNMKTCACLESSDFSSVISKSSTSPVTAQTLHYETQ